MGEIIKAEKMAGGMPREKRDATTPDSSGGNVDGGHCGWLSPKYSESRRVALDWGSLEEKRCLGLLPGSGEVAYCKVLRTRIQQRMRENGWNSLMVTSVHPGEGKTVTAINLAAMFAKEFKQTVLLVDADLRSQAVHRYLGYQHDRGLGDYLLAGCALKDIIVWPGVEKFTVISGGRTIEESTEALNSPRMQELVLEMKLRYKDRYLFFDVPPVLGCADAMAFARFVDAIVVVVRNGRTPMPDIRKALTLLPPEKLIGFIMNAED